MAGDLEIDLRINHPDWEGWEDELEPLVNSVLNCASKQTRAGSIDILLTGDDEIQAINALWRGKDQPTDVLSFPADEDPGNPDFLGDIAISYGVMRADASKTGKPLKAHFSHLLIHGFLHLLGYDHIMEDEAEKMESLERKILAELGHPDPYSYQLTE